MEYKNVPVASVTCRQNCPGANLNQCPYYAADDCSILWLQEFPIALVPSQRHQHIMEISILSMHGENSPVMTCVL